MTKLLERLNELADRVTGAAYKSAETVQDAAKSLVKHRELASRGVDTDEHKLASACLEKGRRYYNEKKYGRAQHYFSKALDHDSGYALAHYYRGLAAYKLDDSDAAVNAWRRVLSLDPDSELAAKAEKRIRGVKGKLLKVIDRLENS